MENTKCKICRRSGAKLFLKGDRCYQQKCAMVRRPYAPGKKGKRRTKSVSEYGQQLREKQRLKRFYNLREQQFKNYVRGILAKKSKSEDLPLKLMQTLENRLDSVVFRLGLASSRLAARQLVSHNNFLVNGKPVDVPSYRVRKGDVVAVSPRKLGKKYFVNLQTPLKKHKTPQWLALDPDKMEGKVTGAASLEDASPAGDIGIVFEFYAR
jgi:small subunit ribosomal protein S4